MKTNYVFDDYGNSVLVNKDGFFYDDEESICLVENKDPVGCQHTPKKVVVSANLKFYVCTKCKADLGDA